ncbi:hypothetical protein N9B86_03455, partial [Planktomarina temperata]|nr:hypothetical protein [Planktomarina temperata]
RPRDDRWPARSAQSRAKRLASAEPLEKTSGNAMSQKNTGAKRFGLAAQPSFPSQEVKGSE